jgi:two-component system response regulator ChvI
MNTAQAQTGSAEHNSPAHIQANFLIRDKQPRVVLVDDDDDYREVVSAELGDYGFAVSDYADIPPLMNHFETGLDADAILLDWNLPSMAGIDLVPILRRRGVRIPVIMLTGMSGTAHEVQALERGVLDFVDKARGVEILAKRLRLIVNASKAAADIPSEDILEHGHLTLRPRLCRAYWRGQDVDLTITEFNIVDKLVRNAGEHVLYRQIYDCVHHCGFIAGSGEDGYRTNVRSSVKRIRNKFRNLDSDFVEIENFPGFGYRWRKSPADL